MLAQKNINLHTAKLIPLATSTTELTDLVEPEVPQGTTHWPDALSAIHEDPGPAIGSKPATVAHDWKSVIE